MDKNQKKFNLYVFLSTFARNLIEVFIPIILYKFGYGLKEVMFYYLLANFLSLIITYPCVVFARKTSYIILSIVGIFIFIIMQLTLNNMVNSYFYLLLIAFEFALYRRCYWFSRRQLNLEVMKDNNISRDYSIISIVNQIGVITSSYIGAIVLDFVGINVLTAFSILLFFLSSIPLFLLKVGNKKIEKKKIDKKGKINDIKEKTVTGLDEYKKDKSNRELYRTIIETVKKLKFSHIYTYAGYELMNIIKFLFPLYLVIYVKNTYQIVGFLSLFNNLATMIFSYLYGKKINNGKNFITASIVLTILVYVLKVNTISSLLILISFMEGIVTKMYEISINKSFFSVSKKFNYESYNFVYEFVQNLSRTIVVAILFLCVKDLKSMIYVTLGIVFLTAFSAYNIKGE